MIKLIVDSGSTKTDWAFASATDSYLLMSTCGINPVVQTVEMIKKTICGELVLLMSTEGIEAADVGEIFFYGAGCIPTKMNVVRQILNETFSLADIIEVNSDLLGAARALCGHTEGIAAILGTGANSCYYDGERIVANTPALGFILGDEGSGAVLGRKFINGILKGWLPCALRDKFLGEYGLTVSQVIDKVYHQPMPNRFLASISEFIYRKMNCFSELETVVEENFEDFISKNILPYRVISEASLVKMNAVGSVAFYYKPQLVKAASKHGIETGLIEKSPLHGLVNYHFDI